MFAAIPAEALAEAAAFDPLAEAAAALVRLTKAREFDLVAGTAVLVMPG